MTTYRVEITAAALEALVEQVRYIAVDAASPLNADRWLTLVRRAAVSLNTFPSRGALAEENEHTDYEVRQLVVKNHLLLYRIDNQAHCVQVVGIRHGQRRPWPRNLRTKDR